MRIVSPFKDYYDCIQSVGFTKEPLFIRDTKSVHFFPQYLIPRATRYKNDDNYDVGCIGFCGTIYPYIRTGNSFDGYQYYYSTKKWGKYSSILEMVSVDWQNKGKIYNRDCSKINDELKTPIFHIDYSRDREVDGQKWRGYQEKNPNLSLLQFQQIKDPYTAFQEIEQWLCNQASPEKPIPQISNNDMIEAKGFDLKYSFRKEKNENKKQRSRNK